MENLIFSEPSTTLSTLTQDVKNEDIIKKIMSEQKTTLASLKYQD